MDLAKYIDHTVLKPEATGREVEQLCREARDHGFAAVCVNPAYVARAAQLLAGSEVAVASVVGFPLGATTTGAKVFEAAEAIAAGASEIDMVMAVGLFKGGEEELVSRDIAAVVEACGERALTKVILETSLLTPEEIVRASQIAADAGAAFVKTSTGFGSRGASLEDVAIMKRAVAGRCRIKASGGIRTREQALAFIAAGADRIGTSAGVTIVKGA